MVEVEEALRELVKNIYSKCYGAYGVGDEGYQGEIEVEIQNLTKAIEGEISKKIRLNEEFKSKKF
jgi:hypothetical protein